MLHDPAAQSFSKDWMIYDYWQHADNPAIRVEAKYDVGNVQLRDKMLQLQQLGFTDTDQTTGGHVSMAGLQSRRLDLIHGTFRTTFKVEGADGGSCASFFWYRDDASELDIEVVTEGTSLVNNTINYTTQPSVNADGTRIPNATLSVPLAAEYNTNVEVFHEHRFDCDRTGGVKFYLDGELMQVDGHNIPRFGGSLQLKLWADGNKWWSGQPSLTTVTMSVKSVIAYFNTSATEDGTDRKWFNACTKAGGPSDKTICEAYAEVGKDDDLPLAAGGFPASQASTMQDIHTASSSGSPAQSSMCNQDGMLRSCPPISQAVRAQPVVLNGFHQFLGTDFRKLKAHFLLASRDSDASAAMESTSHNP